MIQRTTGPWALLCAALTLGSAGRASAQDAGCGAEALADGTVVAWDTASAVTGDFDRDGEADVAYLGQDAGNTLVMIAACRGEAVRERWLFPVPADGACGGTPRLEAASLLVDEAAVARTCAASASASECVHLRRTNRARQALMDAGARALRIAAPGCPGFVLWWSEELGGFARRPG